MVAEALEHLTAARLEVWQDVRSQLARLQAVEQRLLDLWCSLAAVAINAQETSFFFFFLNPRLLSFVANHMVDKNTTVTTYLINCPWRGRFVTSAMGVAVRHP
jgi:hypothetical protein